MTRRKRKEGEEEEEKTISISEVFGPSPVSGLRIQRFSVISSFAQLNTHGDQRSLHEYRGNVGSCSPATSSEIWEELFLGQIADKRPYIHRQPPIAC